MRNNAPPPTLFHSRAYTEFEPEWFSSARNYALYSNQGGIYDDIIRYLKL